MFVPVSESKNALVAMCLMPVFANPPRSIGVTPFGGMHRETEAWQLVQLKLYELRACL